MPETSPQAAASTGLIALVCIDLDLVNDLAHQAMPALAVLLGGEMGRLQQFWQAGSQLAAVKGGIWQCTRNGAQRHGCVVEPEAGVRHATQSYPLTNLSQL